MRISILTVLLAAQMTTGTQNSFAIDSDCEGDGGPTQIFVDCYEETTRDADPISNDSQDLTSSLVTFTYVWLPSCPRALPALPGASSIDCAAMHTCQDPITVQLSLWARQLTDEVGKPVEGGWSIETTECRDPADAGPVEQQRRVLTTADIISAIRQVGVSASSVEGPRFTLVNLDTTFFTEPHPVTRSLTLIGYAVDVEITPASYTWHWGDGASTTTDTPGRPYPATDITHTYATSTGKDAGMPLAVDVTYSARYRVDGGSWQTIPDALTIPGDTTNLPIREAAAVLVGED